MADALDVLESRARFDGPCCAVHVRLAEHGGKVYVDLGDEAWRAVEIDADGWRVVDVPPVKFWHPRGMLPLPIPERGGSLEALRPFVNAADEEAFTLIVSWLVGAMRPRGPYPILDVEGEQGAGKSTLCRILRALIDPNLCSLRRPPREERDLFIAARNGWIVGFDNLSGLPQWLSDALCVLATGGGFATRELYSDAEEALFDAQRPILVNGIDEIGRRGDFRDRCLRVVLPRIEEVEARDEAALWAEFEAARPKVLGALLDAVSAALRRWPSTRLKRTPRMADFARWVVAAEEALPWAPGTFLGVYLGQREGMAWEALEDDPLAQAILAVVKAAGGRIAATASELLAQIQERVDESGRRAKTWPQTPRALSGRLRRLAPDLRRAAGMSVDFTREACTGRRIITLEEQEGNPPSLPSLPLLRGPGSLDAVGESLVTVEGARTVTQPSLGGHAPSLSGGSDGRPSREGATVTQPSLSEALRRKDCDGSDGSDDDSPDLSLWPSEEGEETWIL